MTTETYYSVTVDVAPESVGSYTQGGRYVDIVCEESAGAAERKLQAHLDSMDATQRCRVIVGSASRVEMPA